MNPESVSVKRELARILAREACMRAGLTDILLERCRREKFREKDCDPRAWGMYA